MSRARRLLVVAAAWAVPIVWVAAALNSGPSDGTAISPSAVRSEADRWTDSVTVVRAYGGTPLHAGDIVQRIDGRLVGDWVSTAAPDRSVGDLVRYEVRRPAQDLDRIQTIDVALTHYPVASAMRHNAPLVALALMLLGAATIVYWRRPSAPAVRAFLAAAALLPAGLASYPFGLGAIDLAGSRGVWPQLFGEVACAAGLGALVVSALTLVSTPGWLHRHPFAWAVPFVVPFAGYAVWVATVAEERQPPPARLQALVTVVWPATIATTPVIVAVLVLAYIGARHRSDRLAVRLVLLAIAGGLGARLLLIDLPEQVTGQRLVAWDVLAALLAPALLACIAIALLRHRLEEIEPVVRRALVQALVVAVVGTAFLAAIGAVDLASDSSFESMVAGGAVVLLLLPVALALHRAMRRLLYGDREFPRRVVAELRRLDSLTPPSEALEETLAILARRLRLSWASVEVFGTDDDDPIVASIGESGGPATTVDLVVGGVEVGILQLAVDPARDPFGPGDRRLLEDVGSQVGALVRSVWVNRQLQRSRQSLIAAREEERRRMRRDLHDGLGPSLASLAMGLESARDLIADDPVEASELVERLSEQARDEIGEVRRLVDGLRPPALDQLGLVSALRQRADGHAVSAGAAQASPIAWTVEAGVDVEPLPAAVEVAAYWIVVEAVNNAQRHSTARTCTVTLRRVGSVLDVRVQDTGDGMSSTATMGVGLSSMRERASELGGSCTVTSEPGSGTLIEARLPIGSAAGPESAR